MGYLTMAVSSRYIKRKKTSKMSTVFYIYIYIYIYKVLEMNVGVLTTCHTQNTWDRSICIFYLIEQYSKLFLHTLQVLYICTLFDSTNINMIMNCKHTKRLLTAVRRHLSKLRFKRRNAKLLNTAHHKRKFWEFLDPSVQLHNPISSVLSITSC